MALRMRRTGMALRMRMVVTGVYISRPLGFWVTRLCHRCEGPM